MSSSCVIVGGTIAGRVATNPIVLHVIPGNGLILNTLRNKIFIKKRSNYVDFLLLPMS